MSGTATPCWLPVRRKKWPKILILLILGLPLLAETGGCSKLIQNQINASFKSGGTVLQIKNTSNWDWPHVVVKLNRYAPEGPFTLVINEPLPINETVNVALASFRNAYGSRFDPVKSKVEIISLSIADEDRTFRFN